MTWLIPLAAGVLITLLALGIGVHALWRWLVGQVMKAL